MADAELCRIPLLLSAVKSRLGFTGNHQDETLKGYIKDVIEYLESAGIDSDVAAAVGVISRGVSDLWNYGAGEGKLSEYFYQRAIQLKYSDKGEINNEWISPV